MGMTFGSLFAGIGGFDLGFERAGFECKWQVEIDSYCRRVLTKHWPDVPKWDDVRTFPPEHGEWGVDCIIGGFPCQDISYAGKGAGIEGERSGLFYEAIRIVRTLGPSIVVLENVAALLTRGMDQVLGTLASIGFDAEWESLPAAAFGAPQIRDRCFVVAYSEQNGWCTCESHANGAVLDQRSHQASRQRPTETVIAFGSGQISSERTITGASRKSNTHGHCGHIIGSGWNSEPNMDRVVDGIPGDLDRIACLGNAVVPQIAEYLARRIAAGGRE